ncbi:MAG: glycosyl hydrolase [Pseudomonadota bacterium]
MTDHSTCSRRSALCCSAALLALPAAPLRALGAASTQALPKSAKRGIAYDLANPADLAALSPGVSWWYDWDLRPNAALPANYRKQYDADHFPMLWNDVYNADEVVAYLLAHPKIRYLLVLNEPNLVDQANKTPAQAAAFWPGYESIAQRAGLKIVGPQITWGTMAGFSDPVVWMDAFYAEHQARHGRLPRIDFLGFHWYDYGLAGQLDRLKKYGKRFWVTEFANWHSQPDGAQIDTLEKQMAQMTDMVGNCEQRADVFRYAWFTGRWNPDPHFTSLLAAPGQLSALGRHYLGLPFTRPRAQGAGGRARHPLSAAG